MEKERNFKDKDSGRVIGGLLLVCVGAALLLRNSGFITQDWIFSWPMILILVGIFIGIKSGFRNNAWYILLIVGGYFLLNNSFHSFGLEHLFWPIAIIGLGILFILRPHRHEKFFGGGDDRFGKSPDQTANVVGITDPAAIDESDFLTVRSIFSGVNKKIVSKNFQGGKIACVFGGAEIDLTQADFSGRVLLKLEMVFGGASLIIPPHWSVINELDGVFHGIEDKRRLTTPDLVNPEKVLVLKGSVVFGGMEIKSH